MCGIVALEFLFLFVLAWNTDKKPDSLEKAFNVTLPVAAGLVSSVVTFYFTKKDAWRQEASVQIHQDGDEAFTSRAAG